MKVSELWLREWVNPPITAKALAAQLTMAGLEVDACHPVASAFNRVVVAEVLQAIPHPKADRLSLCDVSAGEGVRYQVVCGASNVRAGLKVAMALPGAELPGGFVIKETKLRGELSQGMLCSAAELGLEERSEGILELPADAPLGADLRDYMTLNDTMMEIDLTPNRADCFSVIGIAREISAINRLAIKAMPVIETEPQTDSQRAVCVQADDACPVYYGRVIQGIHSGAATPLWMKERLRRSGIRPLHPVVDVTNYVMMELGQPMHAFDLQKIDGTIQIRYSTEQESFTLLNDQKVTLNEPVLIIADDHKPLAIAGVMGGASSAVQVETTDIFLESAFFNPRHMAGVARRYGLCTDSSQRFERGVDPSIQLRALERASELLLSIVGGKAGPVTRAEQPGMQAPVSISFDSALVERLTGVSIPTEQMIQILESLGMDVQCGEACWSVTVPLRRFDIRQPVDLVEEIIRINGYDKLAAQPIWATMEPGQTSPNENIADKVARILMVRGYSEAISYSFVDPELQQAIYPGSQPLQLLNPISQELSQMRVGLWPGLIASMIYNVHRQQAAMKLFETGVIFDVEQGVTHERLCVAGLLTGELGHFNWSESDRPYDFYDMKGDLEALFSMLQTKGVEFVPDTHPGLHPGQTSRLVFNGEPLGWVGVLHPRLLDALDLSSDVLLFELSLSALIPKKLPQYQPISKYPKIRRDLSLLVNQEIRVRQIEMSVREVVDQALLKSFDVFDVYLGESIPEGMKSLAVTMVLQDENRTLIDSEINTIIDAILNKLNRDFSITLRD